MRRLLTVTLLLSAAASAAYAGSSTDWSACKDDVEKFQCQKAQNDYDIYRCLTKHDTRYQRNATRLRRATSAKRTGSKLLPPQLAPRIVGILLCRFFCEFDQIVGRVDPATRF